MATTDRLARERTERAFANYITSKKAGTALAIPTDVPVFVRKGKLLDNGTFELQNLDEVPVPTVAVSCPRSKPSDMGYPICELHVMVLNAVDEESAADRASARFGFIADLLDETRDAELKAYINRPAFAPDNRLVKNYNVIACLQTEDMGQETGRHWIDHLVFDVHCNATDDLDGDGQDDVLPSDPAHSPPTTPPILI